MMKPRALALTLVSVLSGACSSNAVTTVFFNSSQTTNLVQAGTTWDIIESEGYLFTMTRDKLFTGGTGTIIGRYLRVHWPEGLEAQAVTEGPLLSKPRIDIARQDGEPFSITSFTMRLLASTAGAGGTLEIMPLINGEDARPDPYTYNATGHEWSQFTYNTPELAGYEAYKVTLYVDFAFMNLTAVDPSIPPPFLAITQLPGGAAELSWPSEAAAYHLESATSFAPSAWLAVTNTVVTNDTVFSVQVEPQGSVRFFRLRK